LQSLVQFMFSTETEMQLGPSNTTPKPLCICEVWCPK